MKYACLETLRGEHQKILKLQNGCISESGHVLSDKREYYNILCKKERNVRDAILYLEELEGVNG